MKNILNPPPSSLPIPSLWVVPVEDLLISIKAKMILFQDYSGNVIDRGEKQVYSEKKNFQTDSST